MPLKALTCDKLIVATGNNFKPKLPDLDLESFDGTSFHSVELGRRYHELVSDQVSHVTVIGGHKSALEAVGICAQAGKNVEWLIRKEGGGPTWMIQPPRSKPLRLESFFGPSVYHPERWLDRFLFSGRWLLGTWIINRFYRFLSETALKGKYENSQNGSKLRPTADRCVSCNILCNAD
jgi:dimethylaniline monooxygenase (N-oxide forming)